MSSDCAPASARNGPPGRSEYATALLVSPSGNQGPAPRDGLLQSISNGVGTTTSFHYATASGTSNTVPVSGGTVPVPVWVVDRIETTNNLGGLQALTISSTYSYSTPLYDPRDRAFVGFRSASERRGGTVFDASESIVGTDATETVTTTTFATDTCARSSSCTSGTVDYSYYHAVRGVPSLVEVTDAAGRRLTTTYNEYRRKPTYQGLDGRQVGILSLFRAVESDYRPQEPERWNAFREDVRYTGHWDDSQVGLIYFGARYYAPTIGRWISPDPLAIHGFAGDPNPYAFVHGSPIGNVDPYGLDEGSQQGTQGPSDSISLDSIASAIGAAISAVGSGIGAIGRAIGGAVSAIGNSLGAPSNVSPDQQAMRAESAAATGAAGEARSASVQGSTPVSTSGAGGSTQCQGMSCHTSYPALPVNIAQDARSLGDSAFTFGMETLSFIATGPENTANAVRTGQQEFPRSPTGRRWASWSPRRSLAKSAAQYWVAPAPRVELAEGAAQGASASSFGAFKNALGPAGEGMQWHHIVEQTPGNLARFGSGPIQNTGNLIRLDTVVHQQILAAFTRRSQPFTGGATVRQWLSTQSFESQQQFGQELLLRFGVSF